MKLVGAAVYGVVHCAYALGEVILIRTEWRAADENSSSTQVRRPG